MPSRLDAELRRLYDIPPVEGAPTRALVLELARPADWTALGAIWRGVQADLGLPAPAIAANGCDGLQLWFALQQPVDPASGRAWLEGLCRRWAPEKAPARWRLWTGLVVDPVPVVPALTAPEQWSAFLAPDLAPIFSDTPWLDLPPSDEGQAALLAGLQPISPEAWTRAAPPFAEADVGATTAATTVATPSEIPCTQDERRGSAPAGPAATNDPRAFLLAVMNDPAQAMALRIEAAKALLPGRTLSPAPDDDPQRSR